VSRFYRGVDCSLGAYRNNPENGKKSLDVLFLAKGSNSSRRSKTKTDKRRINTHPLLGRVNKGGESENYGQRLARQRTTTNYKKKKKRRSSLRDRSDEIGGGGGGGTEKSERKRKALGTLHRKAEKQDRTRGLQKKIKF